MARVLVAFDPTGRLQVFEPGAASHFGIKQAVLDIADDIEDVDIYTLARKLAGMLLEQLRNPERR